MGGSTESALDSGTESVPGSGTKIVPGSGIKSVLSILTTQCDPPLSSGLDCVSSATLSCIMTDRKSAREEVGMRDGDWRQQGVGVGEQVEVK